MDLEDAQADIYVWSPDDSGSIGHCSFSGEEIGEESAALVLRLGEKSEMTANGKNVILPVQQVSIHPEFIQDIEQSLIDLELSSFFTKTEDAVDTICVLCEEKLTEGDRIVLKDKDSKGHRRIQFHCDCEKDFFEMLDAAEDHIVANVI